MKKIFGSFSDEEFNFWMSYTDLISGFLVVFIIVSIVLYNFYSNKSREAEDAQEKYTELISELEKSGLSIDEYKASNARLKNRIDSLELLIKTLRMNDMKNLITSYRDVFISSPEINVKIDTVKGSIILTHVDKKKDLFLVGEADVQGDLKAYLDKIGKNIVLQTVRLYDSGYRNIELRIEGHTDPRWSGYDEDARFLKNLDLSSQRANNVYEYILMHTGLTARQKRFVKEHMIGIGYSFSHRLNDNNENDMSVDPSSRRIEFRIISK